MPAPVRIRRHAPHGRRFVCRRQRGLTLLEAVTAIVIGGIAAAMASAMITMSVQSYGAQGRRASLVDATESALRLMARDIRNALPNSLRVTNLSGGGFVLELVPIIDAGKYTTTGAALSRLNLQGNFDADFDNLGCFQTLTAGVYPTYRIVVNNLGTTGYDVYTSGTQFNQQGNTTGVISAAGISLTITQNAGASCPTVGTHHLMLSANHAFLDSSPYNRFYVVETPLSYICDPAAGTLTRYTGYAFQAAQPTSAALLNALSGVASAIVTDGVAACTVTTSAADVRNRGLATLDLTVTKEGESARLIQQVQVDNSR